jgi:hypothetical protein
VVPWLRSSPPFGRVPFFYYVIHIYLIHALAVVTGFAITGVPTTAPEINFNLTEVYIAWMSVIALLYPLVRRSETNRQRLVVGLRLNSKFASI